jgi:hypothetical protein
VGLDDLQRAELLGTSSSDESLTEVESHVETSAIRKLKINR